MIIKYISQSYQNKCQKGRDALEQGGTSYTLEDHGRFKYSSKLVQKSRTYSHQGVSVVLGLWFMTITTVGVLIPSQTVGHEIERGKRQNG